MVNNHKKLQSHSSSTVGSILKRGIEYRSKRENGPTQVTLGVEKRAEQSLHLVKRRHEFLCTCAMAGYSTFMRRLGHGRLLAF